MSKNNPRKEAFLKELEAAKEGFIQDWFKIIRAKANEYRFKAERDFFMMGAAPECFDFSCEYEPKDLNSEMVQRAHIAGVAARERNPIAGITSFRKTFRFENENGRYTYFTLVLDAVVIDAFIAKVKKSKSFC